ncbi:MAG: M15 family metallopeptidase [Ruminococcus sp.]|nr:M15 family metallopeptidase [Ruminococcus sp.]
MPKNISKEKSINRAKTTVELVVCAIILGTSVFLGKSCFDRIKVVPSTNKEATKIEDIEIPDASDVVDPNKIVFAATPISTKLKFSGNLILVNNDNQYYSTGNENLVSIMEKNDETGRSSFIAVDYDYTILEQVYEPLAKMVDDWYDIYFNDTLIVYGSYRSNEFQQQLYDQFTDNTSNDGEAPIVARPGFSEHETGYALDFSETAGYDYQGTGDFLWLNQNCHKYGFVIRYAEDKEDITEYRYEPWHFRYVGIPHAKYMTEQNLCLEEYIELLRTSYNYNGEHLKVSDEYGALYEIYFYPSDDAAEFTNVPVPTGVKYDISGNNVDGFIVTVHVNEKTEIGNENLSVTTSPYSFAATTAADSSAETTDSTTETTIAY